MSGPRSDLLCWIDLEMTGLDPQQNVIVEIATLLTDNDLEVVAEGPEIIIHASEAHLGKMIDIVRDMHAKSGLTEKVWRSTVNLKDAELETLAFLKQWCQPRKVPLCGNSIGTDRRFLARHLPDIENFLHYRSIDVSTIKELARRWYPEDLASYQKSASAHRAMDDIRQSVAELRYWREHVFRTPTELAGGTAPT